MGSLAVRLTLGQQQALARLESGGLVQKVTSPLRQLFYIQDFRPWGGEESLLWLVPDFCLIGFLNPPYISVNSLFIKTSSNYSVWVCPLFLVGALADIVIFLGMPFSILMAYPCTLLSCTALQDRSMSELTEALEIIQSSNIDGFSLTSLVTPSWCLLASPLPPL